MVLGSQHVVRIMAVAVVAGVLLAAGASNAATVTDSLTTEQKLEDFEYLYRVVGENYPFLWVNERVNGVDWLGEKEEFRQLVEDAESDAEFGQAVAYILSRLNNGHTHVVSSGSSGTGSGGNNVKTSIIEEDRIAYIRIRSFSGRYIEQDRQKVLEFLASISDYPNLLIDIRGNGGGSGSYWRQLLVAPLIAEPVAWRWYLAVRSGEEVQDYMKDRLGAGYYFLQVGRGSLPGLQNVPKEVLTEDFIEPIQVPDVILPANSVGFSGRIFLLVDERVYSSSESFAAFAKTTGWATVVGTTTGGDGIGFDPMLFTLPNSQLTIRMSESMGLNPDGTANEEAKTVPDVPVDVSSQDVSSQDVGSQGVSSQDVGSQGSQRDSVLETAIALCSEATEPAEDGSGRGGLLSRLGWMWEIAKGFTGEDIGLGELIRMTSSDNYALYEGREVEAIEIYGAFDTEESLVRRIVGISPGDRFSPDALGLARKRLLLTSAFRSSALLVRPAGGDRVRVVVFLQEGWWLYLSPRDLGRRVVQDALFNRISVNVYNIGGNLVNIKAMYGFGARSRWSLQVETPVFAGALPLKLSVAAGTQPSGATLVLGTHAGSSFIKDTSIVSLAAQTALSENSSLSVRLSHSIESVSDFSSSTGLPVCDGEFMALSLTLESDMTDVRPVAYEVTAGAIGDSGSGSSSTHGFVVGNSVASVDLSQRNTLVLSGRAGAIHSSAPASQWFLLGGGDAFPEYSRSLLGHSFFSASAELRHSITSGLSLGVMAGVGKVWDTVGSYGLDDPMTRVGAVLRYATPLSLVLEARYTKSITSEAERFLIGVSQSL